MKDSYEKDFDSPEARANFATRHIINPILRKKRRDELITEFSKEKLVDMFPGRSRRNNPERIKSEAYWLQTQLGHIDTLHLSEAETLISQSEDPQRLRATLLCLIFFDQLMFKHYASRYGAFKSEYSIPQFIQNSPKETPTMSFYLYIIQGRDELNNWNQVSDTFIGCVQHLRRWLIVKLGRPVPELKGIIEKEVLNEFNTEHVDYFRAPIGA